MNATVLVLNGETVTCQSAPGTRVLWVLREELGDLSARFGCGEALCGSCMVEVDGRARHACDLPLWSVEGKSLRTARGLPQTAIGRALLHAFEARQAAQCGYCIPGVLMAAHALLAVNPLPDDTAIRAALARNLCRCGSHVRILAAIRAAAQHLGEAAAGTPGSVQ